MIRHEAHDPLDIIQIVFGRCMNQIVERHIDSVKATGVDILFPRNLKRYGLG
jgi:hypothetical protein